MTSQHAAATDTTAATATGSEVGADPRDPSVRRAIGYAWITWTAMLLVSLLLLGAAFYRVFTATGARPAVEQSGRWSWLVGGYMAVAVSLAFAWRGRLFRNYYRRRPVPPVTYLWGMIGVWTALASSAVLGCVAALKTHALLPNGSLSLLAIVTMMAMWPKGTAMTDPKEMPGDFGDYEEPR